MFLVFLIVIDKNYQSLSSSEALNFLCYEVEASSMFWSSTVSRHNIFNIDGNINIDGHFRRDPNDLDAL